MDIANNIKKRIREKGKTITSLAEQIGVLPSQLSRTINNPNIRLSDLQMIADAINCEVIDFMFPDVEQTSVHLCPHCRKPIHIRLDKE